MLDDLVVASGPLDKSVGLAASIQLHGSVVELSKPDAASQRSFPLHASSLPSILSSIQKHTPGRTASKGADHYAITRGCFAATNWPRVRRHMAARLFFRASDGYHSSSQEAPSNSLGQDRRPTKDRRPAHFCFASQLLGWRQPGFLSRAAPGQGYAQGSHLGVARLFKTHACC